MHSRGHRRGGKPGRRCRSRYLFTHPEVNNVFSSVHGMPTSQAISTVQAYLAANPQTQAEIDAVRSPVQDLRNRCNIPAEGLIRGVLME